DLRADLHFDRPVAAETPEDAAGEILAASLEATIDRGMNRDFGHGRTVGRPRMTRNGEPSPFDSPKSVVTEGDDFWIKPGSSCTNTQLVTKPSTSLGRGRLLLGVATLGAALLGACGKHGMSELTSLDGGSANGEPWADDLLSDFEDTTAALVVRLGWPPRNGFWYTFNDGSRTCTQTPKPAAQATAAGAKPATYVGATP